MPLHLRVGAKLTSAVTEIQCDGTSLNTGIELQLPCEAARKTTLAHAWQHHLTFSKKFYYTRILHYLKIFLSIYLF